MSVITERIQKNYYNFTAAERKVADFVLNSPQTVTGMTVHSLAEACFVASSAVIRFCKSVGLGGFSELKIELARELGSGNEKNSLTEILSQTNTEETVNRVFDSGINTLLGTKNMLDYEKIKKITEKLSSAKRIFIFALGTSSIIATDVQYRLSQLGFFTNAYTDILFMNVTAVNLKAGDVVLAISHSGRTKAVVDAVRHANKAGATTLAVTSFADSLLYKESDIAVSVYADEVNYPVEAVSARLAHICLLDAIAMALAAEVESLPSKVKARNKILKEIRY